MTTNKEIKKSVFVHTYGWQMDAKKDDYGENY